MSLEISTLQKSDLLDTLENKIKSLILTFLELRVQKIDFAILYISIICIIILYHYLYHYYVAFIHLMQTWMGDCILQRATPFPPPPNPTHFINCI